MDFIIKNIDNSYEHVANSLLISLYEYVHTYYDENNTNQSLEGKVEVLRGYQSMIDYLQERFPSLYIMISRNSYVEFEDDLCKQYLSNELGDGLGVIESDLVNVTLSYANSLRLPAGVTKFNEFKYFKSITQLFGYGNSEPFFMIENCKDTLEEIDLILININQLYKDNFKYFTNLKIVHNTENITSIGAGNFYGCISLENIKLNNLINLGGSCFRDCTNLKTALIDGTFTLLADNMFNNCTSLETVKGFSSITRIDSYAFNNCKNLTTLDIPFENILTVGRYSFQNCNSLDMDNFDFSNVTYFDENAFTGSPIRSIQFTDQSFQMRSQVFRNCKNLTSIVIPNNVVTKIVDFTNSLFNSCINLISITLPSNQDNFIISAYFAYNCTLLEEVIGIDKCIEIANDAFRECKNLKNIDLSNCINIRYNVFQNCTSLETVTTGSNLNKIDAQAFANDTLLKNIDLSNCIEIGNSAFYNCTSLQTINLSNCINIGICAFQNCTSINNVIGCNNITDIKRSGFYNLGNSENLLGKMSFPSLTILRETVFAYSNCITELEFSENLTAIESFGQFRNSPNLKKVTGLTALNTLGANMFWNCTSLEEVELSENITVLPDSIFETCKSLKTLIFPNVTTLQNECFYNANIETLSLPSLTETPNNNAFLGCKIKHLSIPNVTNIVKEHFRDNIIETLDVSSLVSGPRYMFYGNTKLTEVSLPSMIMIPQDGFRNCTALTTVNITSTTTTIGQSAFNSCSSLKNIDISHVTNIKGWAFENNTALKSIDLSSCEELLEGAFKGCTGLNTDITIPSTITSLSRQVFYNCQNIKSLYLSANQIVSIGQESLYMGTYPIYVPDNLVDSYKNASGWTSFSTRIKPISEKPNS